jgi:hypothetical protein
MEVFLETLCGDEAHDPRKKEQPTKTITSPRYRPQWSCIDLVRAGDTLELADACDGDTAAPLFLTLDRPWTGFRMCFQLFA